MNKTFIENPIGNISFNYIVNDGNNDIGKSTIDFAGDISLYLLTDASVDYDLTASKLISETNPTSSSKSVIAKVILRITNSSIVESNDIYISLNGLLGYGYEIIKIDNISYITEKYNIGQWVNVNKVPSMKGNTLGYKDIEILIAYNGDTPGLVTYLQVSGYENNSRYKISSKPKIKIISVFSRLIGKTVVVDSDNMQLGTVVNIISGDTLYYLTTISNVGNADANEGTIVRQSFMKDKFTIEEVKYGSNLNELSSGLEKIEENSFSLNIPSIILKSIDNKPGVYYIRVKLKVK